MWRFVLRVRGEISDGNGRSCWRLWACVAVALVVFSGCLEVRGQDLAGLSAREIMELVNERYDRIKAVPRAVDIHYTTITRQAGRADFTVTGTAVGYQKYRLLRMDFLDGTVRTEPFEGLPAEIRPSWKSMSWVYDGEEMNSVMVSHPFNSPDRRTETVGTRFSTADMPRKFMPTQEFDDVFLDAEFVARPNVLNGRKIVQLSSVGRFDVHPDKHFEFEFWILPETLDIVRIQFDGEYAPRDGEPGYMSGTVDLATNFGVNIAPEVFELAMPPDTRDVTAEVIETARSFLP